jgi:hypothetical protein
LADDSSEESEYVESDVADGVGLDTDLTDIDTCTDEDDEDDKQCEGAECYELLVHLKITPMDFGRIVRTVMFYSPAGCSRPGLAQAVRFECV